jgi:nitroreductase
MDDTTRSLREPALTLVQHAVLAPSSHNTQPWRFRLSDGAIDLLADRTRALPVNDPDDRELTISCGAALMNLRITAASLGVEVAVTPFPDASEPDWLARVALAAGRAVVPGDAELAGYVERRRTYRRRFAARSVEPATVEHLRAAAAAENAVLTPFESEAARLELAALVAEGDDMQWANPSWRRELAMWMHPRRQGDGLTVPELIGPVAQFVVRTFDMGGGVGARDRDLAAASPLLAVVTTRGDSARDWLQAGQALQRVLLTGCRHGLQASYLNQPIEVGLLRGRLQRLAAGGVPQILMRLGYPADEIPASPRRALDDVIDAAG